MALEVLISSKSGLVSGTNWAPALASAFGDVEATGGTIIFDAVTEFNSGVDMSVAGDQSQSIFIQGRGAECNIDAASGDNVFRFGNQNSITIRDMMFTGEEGTSSTKDCSSVIYAGVNRYALVENCEFAGLLPNGGIVVGDSSTLEVRNARFGGCGGDHIKITSGPGLIVKNVYMNDYFNILGRYYDRQQGRSWISAVGGATSPVSIDNAGFVKVENARLDEGSAIALLVEGYTHVEVDQLSYNVGGGTAGGIRLTDVEHAVINQYWAGYGTSGKSILLDSCGEVIVEGLRQHNGDKPIVLDAATRLLSVRHSPGVVVEAEAGSTYEIDGVRYQGGKVRI